MHFAGEPTKSSKTELSYLKSIPYWHKPGGGILEVGNHLRAKGTTSITKADNAYVELWVGTLVACALSKHESLDFWIAKPKEDPPDIAIMTISEKGKFLAREIEVTRAFSPDKTLIETILHKDKSYPITYILACFLEYGVTDDLLEVSNNLQESLKHIKNVVLVFHGKIAPYPGYVSTQEDLQTIVSVVQVNPVFDVTEINLLNELNSWKANDEKLVYVKDAKIYYGLRPGDSYPNII